MDETTRRRLLRSSVVGVGAALSGCLRLAGTEDGTETGTTEATDTETPTPEDAPEPTETTASTAEPTEEPETETQTSYPVSLAEQWRQFFEAVGPPLVTDDRIFVPTRNQGVTAVTADGELDWQTVVASGYVPWHRPTLHDGDLYLSAFEDDVGLFRVDAESGDIAESRSVGPSGGPVAATDDGVVVGTDHNEGTAGSEETLFGFDRTALSELWSAGDSTQYRGGVGYDGTAVVGFGAGIEARDPATGDVQWSADLYAIDPPIVHDGSLYVVSTVGETRVLRRFDPATGEAAWTHENPTNDTIYVRGSNPVFADGIAYLASAGSLYAIDAATGERQWAVEIGKPIDESPAVVGGHVWVTPTTQDGRNRELLGYDAADGTRTYHDTLLAETVRPFALDDHLVVNMGNQLAAFAVEE